MSLAISTFVFRTTPAYDPAALADLPVALDTNRNIYTNYVRMESFESEPSNPDTVLV